MAEGDFQFRGSDIEPSPAAVAGTVNGSTAIEDGDMLTLASGVFTKTADNVIPTHLAMGDAAIDAETLVLPLHKGMTIQAVFTDASLVQGDAVGYELTAGVGTFGKTATTKCADTIKVLDATAKIALFRMRNAAVSA